MSEVYCNEQSEHKIRSSSGARFTTLNKNNGNNQGVRPDSTWSSWQYIQEGSVWGV